MTEKDEYRNKREEYEADWQDEFGNIRYCESCGEKVNIVTDGKECDGYWFHRDCYENVFPEER